MSDFARLLIVLGLAIAFIGFVLLVATRYLPWLGNLPGDFQFENENTRVYFPLATMLLISILGTILLNILLRIFRR